MKVKKWLSAVFKKGTLKANSAGRGRHPFYDPNEQIRFKQKREEDLAQTLRNAGI